MSTHIENYTQTIEDLQYIEAYFDPVFYRACYPEIQGDDNELLLEYHLIGWKNLRDPSACFSTEYYLFHNEDVRDAKIDPLLHYVLYGNGESRPISNSKQNVRTRDENIDSSYDALKIRTKFDSKFYIESNPDVASAGVDPLMHYCRFGWKELRDPTPTFSTSLYLNDHGDVKESGSNPFVHYIVYGIQEGRSSRPSYNNANIISNTECDASEKVLKDRGDIYQISEEEEKIAGSFDETYYLDRYPDVRQSNISPLRHYYHTGWKEGRNPSLSFSTQYYLENNPDVASAGINPLLHYVSAGESEGRQPQSLGGYRLDILKNLLPLDEEVQHWLRPNTDSAQLMTIDELEKVFSHAFKNSNKSLIVCFSHDNYLTQCGGVQICIQREQLLAQAKGFAYLNIHPIQPLPRLAMHDVSTKVNLILDGVEIGTSSMSAIIMAAENLGNYVQHTVGVVHHLLGHAPEEASALLKAFGANDCLFWVHDFFSICTGYTLQRNNVSFCGAPPLDSNSCSLCRYGYDRPLHLERIQNFFSEFKMHVISPSQVTKDFWYSKTSLGEKSIFVLPHLMLDFSEKNTEPRSTDWPINIAFIGYPAPHKGWNIYEQLATRYREDKRYSFHYFGKEEIAVVGTKCIFVNSNAAKPNSMIDSLKSNKIDIVIHWASWPETFSFSTYEAIAAGTAVVTNSISGNVAASVQNLRSGIVLPDIESLFEAFESGEAMSWGNAARKKRSNTRIEVSASNMSINIIKEILES